ncbi:MAG: glucose-1-phosphate adenylyltransferase [Candidatus Aminicenantes bacterium]|nr:glucose-1-phosphate adenylyltransferase [Candidatus Aminicenantes bacterium]
MARVVSVIMAGGQGARLSPLTKIRSKPAVPIAGRFRLIDIPISNCIHSGFRRIFILTQFASVSLHRHIFASYRFDGFQKEFITILAAQQTFERRDWFQGTADAVRQNLVHIEGVGDRVLLLSGDHLYRMDYRKFLAFHERSGADITISVIPVMTEAVGEFGVMKVDASGRIVEFKEKPRDAGTVEAMRVPETVFEEHGISPGGRTHLASMGIYVFEWQVLKDLLEGSTEEDFGRQVIPRAIKERRVFAYFFDEYWEDIGTIPGFFEANINLTRPLPRFNFYDEDRPIFTNVRYLPGAKILGADIQSSILCEGSIINRSSVRDSIVGVRSRVGEACRLERVVMMGADYYESREDLLLAASRGVPGVGIGRDSEIRNAIIDKNARIGDGVRIVNARGIISEASDNYSIVGGIVVIPKNAVIPPGSVI